MNDQDWLGNAMASLYDVPQDAGAQYPPLPPPPPPPQYPLPQVDINSLIPNAPPQISGNLTVPVPLGELFASGKYQAIPQAPPEAAFNLGYRRRF